MEIWYPRWDLHGKGAGFARNRAICYSADRIVAFWDGESRGTKHTVDTAQADEEALRRVRPSRGAMKRQPKALDSTAFVKLLQGCAPEKDDGDVVELMKRIYDCRTKTPGVYTPLPRDVVVGALGELTPNRRKRVVRDGSSPKRRSTRIKP